MSTVAVVPQAPATEAARKRAGASEGKQIRVTNECWEALRQARIEIIAERGELLDSYSDVIMALIRGRAGE